MSLTKEEGKLGIKAGSSLACDWAQEANQAACAGLQEPAAKPVRWEQAPHPSTQGPIALRNTTGSLCWLAAGEGDPGEKEDVR